MDFLSNQPAFIRAASILFYITGVLGVVIFLPTTVATAFFGAKPGGALDVNPADLGYIQGIGGRLYLASIALVALLSILETLAARWIGMSLKAGAILGLLAVVPGFVLSVGLALPIWLVLHPLKVILLLLGWSALH